MSLAEIPRNHVRRNGQVTAPQAAQQKDRLRAVVQDGDENFGISQKPSSIQSMLKNTTEIGDVGQFSVKPPRVPVSNPQLSPASSGKSRTRPNRPWPHGPELNGYTRYNGSYQQYSPIQGSIVSNRAGSHGQGHRGPYRMPSFEDYQSYPVSQGSYNNLTQSYRHPHTNGYHRDPGEVNMRPRSPYAYPTRLKRPGYRPSSPALNELTRSMAAYHGLTRGPSTRTTSPMSAYSMARTPSPFRYVVNRSDPDLQHYPPYLMMEPKRTRSPSVTSTRPSTPKASRSVTSISNSSQVYRKLSVTNDVQTRSKTPPNSPLYYDYTEEFETQDTHQYSVMPVGLVNEQSSLHMHPSPDPEFGESPSDSGIAELPSENSPPRTTSQTSGLSAESGTSEIDVDNNNFVRTGPQDLSDVPELPEKEMAATEVESQSGKIRRSRACAPSDRRSLGSTSIRVSSAEERLPSLHDGHLRRSPTKPADGIKTMDASVVPNQGFESPTGSMFSVRSTISPESRLLTPEPVRQNRISFTSQLKLRIPANDDVIKESRIEASSPHPSESLPRPSFEGHSGVSTEILSPTPERSIVSANNRDRFSKILSIDEGSSKEYSLFGRPPRRDDRMNATMQGTQDVPVGEVSGIMGPFRRKRSLQARDSPLKHNVANEALIEKSDSEDEPELTIGLRQTFCKDDTGGLRYHKQDFQIPLVPQLATNKGAPPLSVQSAVNAKRSSTDSRTTLRVTGTENIGGTGDVERLPDCANVSRPPEQPFGNEELPRQPRKKPSFRSYSPDITSSVSELPLGFTPLTRRPSEDNPSATAAAPKAPNVQIGSPVHQHEALHEAPLGSSSVTSGSCSGSSRPASRPWNLESSYPWNHQAPELEVSMPQPPSDSDTQADEVPQFKLKIHRASSLTAGTSKVKEGPRLSETNERPSALSHEHREGPALQRKKHPNLSVLPGQNNSSHDMIHSSRQRTRFVDTFETQSPTISLIPPSPNYEARSFFSDDSSRVGKKGTLRKRFSDFRARAAAARGASLDESRGYDRGLLRSALGRISRASGRSSRQSHTTAGTSTRTSLAQRIRWKMIDKIKLWLHRGEDKIRGWGGKKRYRNERNRAESAPYAGV